MKGIDELVGARLVRAVRDTLPNWTEPWTRPRNRDSISFDVFSGARVEQAIYQRTRGTLQATFAALVDRRLATSPAAAAQTVATSFWWSVANRLWKRDAAKSGGVCWVLRGQRVLFVRAARGVDGPRLWRQVHADNSEWLHVGPEEVRG